MIAPTTYPPHSLPYWCLPDYTVLTDIPDYSNSYSICYSVVLSGFFCNKCCNARDDRGRCHGSFSDVKNLRRCTYR